MIDYISLYVCELILISTLYMRPELLVEFIEYLLISNYTNKTSIIANGMKLTCICTSMITCH